MKVSEKLKQRLKEFVDDLGSPQELSKKYRCTKIVKTEDGFKRIVKDDRPDERQS